MLWMGGLKYTYAAVVGILSQTSVVFQAVLAALILKDAFGRRRIVALLLAIAGVAIVTLGEHLQAA
jgi:drug/metabolite transporter (DMT)-like permease